jgi:hypothetical protein
MEKEWPGNNMKTYKKYLNENAINEGLTETELNKINPEADTVNIQVKDFDGNSTKWLGMNQKAGLMALKKFIEKRLKSI